MIYRIIISAILLLAYSNSFAQKWETTRTPVANSACEIDANKVLIPLGFDTSTGISNAWYQLDTVRCIAGQQVWDLVNIRTCSTTQMQTGSECLEDVDSSYIATTISDVIQINTIRNGTDVNFVFDIIEANIGLFDIDSTGLKQLIRDCIPPNLFDITDLDVNQIDNNYEVVLSYVDQDGNPDQVTTDINVEDDDSDPNNEIQTLVGGQNTTVNGNGTSTPWSVDVDQTSVAAGANVNISGTGTTLDPYIVSSTDTDTQLSCAEVVTCLGISVGGDLTQTGSGTVADPYVISYTDIPADGSETILTTGGDLTITGSGTVSDPYVVSYIHIPSDGSETNLTAGMNVSVTGTGTAIDPYIVSSTDTDTQLSCADVIACLGISVSGDLSITGTGSIADPYIINYNHVESNGSETIVTAGANATVTGSGTIADPYVVVSTDTRNTLTTSDADVTLVPTVLADGSTSYDIAVDHPIDLDWTFNVQDGVNGLDSLTIYNPDGSVGYVLNDTGGGATTDNGDFTVVRAVNTDGDSTYTFTHLNSDGTQKVEITQSVNPKTCDGTDVTSSTKIWHSTPLVQADGYGVIYDNVADCPSENDEFFDTSLSSYAGSSKDFANVASGLRSRVGNGTRNIASGTDSGVFVGNDNTASGLESFVGGGDGNTASGAESVVGGGRDNIASGILSNIDGGARNTQIGNFGITGGGRDNVNGTGDSQTIGGGDSNIIEDANQSTISGGLSNQILDGPTAVAPVQNTISGGAVNIIDAEFGNTIGGGQRNSILQTIAGGAARLNYIGGGVDNTIDGRICNGILSGGENKIGSGSNLSFNVINGGNLNNIFSSTDAGLIANNTISGGLLNEIVDSWDSAIGNGNMLKIDKHAGAFMVGWNNVRYQGTDGRTWQPNDYLFVAANGQARGGLNNAEGNAITTLKKGWTQLSSQYRIGTQPSLTQAQVLPLATLHVATVRPDTGLADSGALLAPMTLAARAGITGVNLQDGLEVYCTDCIANDASTGVKQVYQLSTTTWKNLW